QTQRNPAAPPQQGSIFPPDEPSAEPVEDDDLLHEVASAKKRTLTRPSGTSDIPGSFPPEAPRTLKGFPHVGVPKIESLAPDAPPVHERTSSLPPRTPLLSRRIVPL